MNEPLIMWEKWIDPFGKDVDQAKWTDYNNNIPNIYEDNLVEDEEQYNLAIKRFNTVMSAIKNRPDGYSPMYLLKVYISGSFKRNILPQSKKK